jgi:hypothetical protein
MHPLTRARVIAITGLLLCNCGKAADDASPPTTSTASPNSDEHNGAGGSVEPAMDPVVDTGGGDPPHPDYASGMSPDAAVPPSGADGGQAGADAGGGGDIPNPDNAPGMSLDAAAAGP